MTFFRSLLVLSVFLLASSAHAYTYPSPLTPTGATSVSGQGCTGSVIATIGSASGSGALPSTDSLAWGLLGSNYAGGLPAAFNSGSYCIRALYTVTTSGGGGGGGGGGADWVFNGIDILSLLGIERAFAQTSTWSVVYTVHSGSGKAAQVNAYALIYAAAPPTPTASLTVSPGTITQGSSSALTWSSSNATSCAGTGFSTGGATSGTVSVTPSTTTTYSVTCSGTGGSSSPTSRTVTVNPPPQNSPTATLVASPSSVGSGQNVTLTWSSANAVSCSSTQFDTQGATSGSVVVTPIANTTYNITCYGSGGTTGGTWQYENTDYTDLACPWTDPNRPYGGMPNCPDSPPTGACSGSPSRCKINYGGSGGNMNNCVVVTEVYSCSVGTPAPSISDDAIVTVAANVTATIDASSVSVSPGDAVTLTWSSTGADRCVAQQWPIDSGATVADLFSNVSSAVSGNDVVRPTEDTTYGIYCYAPGYGGDTGGGTYTWELADTFGEDFCEGSGGAPGYQTSCPVRNPSGLSCTGYGTTCETVSGGQPCMHRVYQCGYGQPVFDNKQEEFASFFGSFFDSLASSLTASFAPTARAQTSCSPQSATYYATCVVDQEPRDIQCPDGFRVEITNEACVFGRNMGSNNRDWREVASCVPCEGGGTVVDDGGSGNDWAYDTVTVEVDLPECRDGEDNDGTGGADYGTDPDCTDPDDDTEGPSGTTCSPNPTDIDVPGTVTYTASGGTAPYTWTPSAGTTSCAPNPGNPTVCTITVAGEHAMSVNGDACSQNVTAGCAGPETVSLTAITPKEQGDSVRVVSGSSVTLSWEISGVNAPTTCSLTGVGDVTPAEGICEATDSQSVGPITTQTVYTLSCGNVSDSVIVNIATGLIEF